MKQVKISGTGSYLPEKILTNADLEKLVDTTAEWIVERVGIERRHIVAEGENASDMAVAAGAKAISAAGLSNQEIDLVIVGTASADYAFPSVACLVQHRLGIKPCPAYDLSAACSGFIYAMHAARQAIKAGEAQHVLVVGVEVMSRLTDWTDRNTCVLFGDGAGAVVLSASDEPGIISSHISADGCYSDLLYVPNKLPGQHDELAQAHLVMQGKEVFKIAVNTLEKLVIETLKANNIQQSEIDWLIPHQANKRIIAATAKKLGLPMEQVILTLPDQGNTSCASIPLALDIAVNDGRVKRGDLILFETFGGGLTWGAALVRF